MRVFEKCKDGGKDSPVDAYFLFEIKKFMSIALLKFNKGGRENYHSHAFHALTWFICGDMKEERITENGVVTKKYKRSFIPKFTSRENLHRVSANKDSYAFTIRFNWKDSWIEYNEKKNQTITLINGRKVVNTKEGICK